MAVDDRPGVAFFEAACVSGACATAAVQASSSALNLHKRLAMNRHATGTFNVSLNPLDLNEVGEGETRGRISINKTFHGDLEAISIGEMLSAMTEVKGSAGYVAMERVVGSLQGRQGSFVLQHSGTMDRGTPTLSVTVVPDSGTAALTGLRGSLNITIREGVHCYGLDYGLEDSP